MDPIADHGNKDSRRVNLEPNKSVHSALMNTAKDVRTVSEINLDQFYKRGDHRPVANHSQVEPQSLLSVHAPPFNPTLRLNKQIPVKQTPSHAQPTLQSMQNTGYRGVTSDSLFQSADLSREQRLAHEYMVKQERQAVHQQQQPQHASLSAGYGCRPEANRVHSSSHHQTEGVGFSSRR